MRRMRLFRILAVATALSLVIPAIAVPVAAAETAKPYVVVMAADPIVAYDGGTAGIAATKPSAGKKVDRRSLAAQRYGALLRGDHDRSLKQAGVAAAEKLHDYAFSLNGYAAMLTPSQADRSRSRRASSGSSRTSGATRRPTARHGSSSSPPMAARTTAASTARTWWSA